MAWRSPVRRRRLGRPRTRGPAPGRRRTAARDTPRPRRRCSSLNRIAHWSNPNVFWYGRVTGTTTSNDNARVLNNTRTTVAGFRSEPVFSVSISGPTSLAYKELGTWTANVSNAPGSVTYRWYESYDGTTYYDLGITTQTMTRRGYERFWLKVTATSAGQTKTDTHSVWVACASGSLCPVEPL